MRSAIQTVKQLWGHVIYAGNRYTGTYSYDELSTSFRYGQKYSVGSSRQKRECSIFHSYHIGMLQVGLM